MTIAGKTAQNSRHHCGAESVAPRVGQQASAHSSDVDQGRYVPLHRSSYSDPTQRQRYVMLG